MSDSKKCYASRKGTKHSPAYSRRRKITSKKRPLNRFELEKLGVGSPSAKKIKAAEDVNVDAAFGYRILNFVAVFSAVSEVVKCKACGSSVKFTESGKRGLGFKIIVSCDKCAETSIPNSPLVDKTYEINRRFILIFRILGIGLNGMEKFCAFMELPCPILRTFYSSAIEKIAVAAESVAKNSMAHALEEERLKSTEKNSRLTVSGDGSWRERAFSSIDGVVTLIGWFTGKVIDVIVKSKHCAACELWRKKHGTEEYAEWMEGHHRVCEVNNDQFTGKAEDDAVVEMFKRSRELYAAEYENYVAEGDPKNYRYIPDAKPYEDITVELKESVDHAQKKMRGKLRNLKRVSKSLRNDELTGKLVDELSTLYGQAIRQHRDSVEKMRDAIWATLFHKLSSDKKPQHQKCPSGGDSWCSWQKAKATDKLAKYKHEPSMSQAIFNAVKPVYEELSSQEILRSYVDGSVEGSKESFNAMIWSMAPKEMSKSFNIATSVAACVCNDGIASIMQVMQALGMPIGQHCYGFCIGAESRLKPFSRGNSWRLEEGEVNLDGQMYGAGLD